MRLFRSLGAPAPPPFVPTTLTNLSLWLDGADPAATGSVPSDGSTLSTWVDKSGNSRNLITRSGTVTWNTNSVRLNSSYMSVLTPVDLSSASFFLVMASPVSVSNQSVFSAIPDTANDWSSLDGIGHFIDNNDGVRIYGISAVGQYAPIAATGSTSPFCLSTICTSSGSITSRRNGGTPSSGTHNPRTNTAQGFGIGASWAGKSSVNTIISKAHIYEIVVYNTSLTSSQREQLEGYLAWKWNLQATLPVNHPYYTAKP